MFQNGRLATTTSDSSSGRASPWPAAPLLPWQPPAMTARTGAIPSISEFPTRGPVGGGGVSFERASERTLRFQR